MAPIISSFDMMVFLEWCSDMDHVVVFSAFSIHYSLIFLRLYDCTTKRLYVFKACSAIPPMEDHERARAGPHIKTVAGVWSSRIHGLRRPDVISYVSLLERAESLPLVSFVVPWKRDLWRVVQKRVGYMSSNEFVSGMAYCCKHMDQQTYGCMSTNMNAMKMDDNLERRMHKLHSFVYQRMMSCLREEDACTFVELLQ